MKVIVASKSNIKLNAVKEAVAAVYDEYNYTISGVDSVSGVNNQPYGYDQITEGAQNRLNSCHENIPLNDQDTICCIAIENGVIRINSIFYDIACIIVENYSTGEVYTSFSTTVEIPREIVYKVVESNYEKTVGDIIDPNNSKDPHSILTNFILCRKDILRQALVSSLSQLENKNKKEITKGHELGNTAFDPDYGFICTHCGTSAQAQHVDCWEMDSEDGNF